MSDDTCWARLGVKGEVYACDTPGQHYTHGNVEAGAIWCSDAEGRATAKPTDECLACGHWTRNHDDQGCAIVTGNAEETASVPCPCAEVYEHTEPQPHLSSLRRQYEVARRNLARVPKRYRATP